MQILKCPKLRLNADRKTIEHYDPVKIYNAKTLFDSLVKNCINCEKGQKIPVLVCICLLNLSPQIPVVNLFSRSYLFRSTNFQTYWSSYTPQFQISSEAATCKK